MHVPVRKNYNVELKEEGLIKSSYVPADLSLCYFQLLWIQSRDRHQAHRLVLSFSVHFVVVVEANDSIALVLSIEHYTHLQFT